MAKSSGNGTRIGICFYFFREITIPETGPKTNLFQKQIFENCLHHGIVFPIKSIASKAPESSRVLSKSKYLSGLQCQKLLWYQYNAKDAFPPVDAETQAIFDQGHDVGTLAKTLFPGGIEIESPHWNLTEVMSLSHEALKLRKPIFEAGFNYQNAFARVDILNPVGKNQWDIIEVKSSTSVKDINLQDLSLQRYAYEGAGLKIRRCYLMFINRDYVRRGDIEPKKFFTQEDVTDAVSELLPSVPKNLQGMVAAIQGKKCPEIPIGPHCNDPYPCPLQGICWKNVPENSVFKLNRVGKKAFEWFSQGYRRITDLDEGMGLTTKQKIQLKVTSSGRPFMDKQNLRSFLASLKYPLSFLDFETFYTAIPQFDQCRPYQQIPFQFSLHIAENGGADLVHHEFLADGRKDPRRLFLESLVNVLGKSGSIVAYNASFERQRLTECCELYPKFKPWLAALEPRIVDLLDPFRAFHYYHPDQLGSASIKEVMPALIGRGYDGLEIADGSAASQEFLRMTFGKVAAKEEQRIRSALKKYCGLDTEAMALIVKELGRLVR